MAFSSCTVCWDQSPITLPDATVPTGGSSRLPCGLLEQTVTPVLPSDSSECRLLQSVGSLCGCPPVPNACGLCRTSDADGTAVEQDIPPSRRNADSFSFLTGLLGDTLPGNSNNNNLDLIIDCTLLQAYSQFITKDDPLCTVLDVLPLAEYCCTAEEEVPFVVAEPCETCCIHDNENTVAIITPTTTTSPENESTVKMTCQQAGEAARFFWEATSDSCAWIQELTTNECDGNRGNDDTTTNQKDPPSPIPCTLCRDGSSVTLPEQSFPFLPILNNSNNNSNETAVPTCANVETLLGIGYTENSEECQQAQALSAHCGCPTAARPCHFCPKPNDTILFPDRYHYHTWDRNGVNVTCQQLELALLQYDRDSLECFLAQETNWECGCNDGFYGYLGSETERDHRLVVWMGRASGLLGLLGALSILVDYIRIRRRHPSQLNIYRQLMCFISLFDALSAMIWIIGPVSTVVTSWAFA